MKSLTWSLAVLATITIAEVSFARVVRCGKDTLAYKVGRKTIDGKHEHRGIRCVKFLDNNNPTAFMYYSEGWDKRDNGTALGIVNTYRGVGAATIYPEIGKGSIPYWFTTGWADFGGNGETWENNNSGPAEKIYADKFVWSEQARTRVPSHMWMTVAGEPEDTWELRDNDFTFDSSLPEMQSCGKYWDEYSDQFGHYKFCAKSIHPAWRVMYGFGKSNGERFDILAFFDIMAARNNSYYPTAVSIFPMSRQWHYHFGDLRIQATLESMRIPVPFENVPFAMGPLVERTKMGQN